MSKRHKVFNKNTGCVLCRTWTRSGARRAYFNLRSRCCAPLGYA